MRRNDFSGNSGVQFAGNEPGMYQTGGGSVQSCISLQSGEKDISMLMDGDFWR